MASLFTGQAGNWSHRQILRSKQASPKNFPLCSPTFQRLYAYPNTYIIIYIVGWLSSLHMKQTRP